KTKPLAKFSVSSEEMQNVFRLKSSFRRIADSSCHLMQFNRFKYVHC
ncbi:Dihydrophenazinedicarboxylate synthase, partial [Trichinella pseudospiralis]